MGQKGRSGCRRPLAGGLLGGVLGMAAAIAIGVLDAPDVDPDDPLANEWYTPFALFVFPVCASILGAIAGCLMAEVLPVVDREAASRGAAGLFLGLSLGALAPARGEGIQLLGHFFMTVAFVCWAVFVPSGKARKRLLQYDDLRA